MDLKPETTCALALLPALCCLSFCLDADFSPFFGYDGFYLVETNKKAENQTNKKKPLTHPLSLALCVSLCFSLSVPLSLPLSLLPLGGCEAACGPVRAQRGCALLAEDALMIRRTARITLVAARDAVPRRQKGWRRRE